ncbi:MAG: alpha/beta hydrolase [Acidobacteriota bacterium]
MNRRTFFTLASTAAAAVVLHRAALAARPETIDAAWYERSRRFANLPMGRIAYVEAGRGPAAALFLHAFPLNSFQWRGALQRLQPYRRCIAPDLMSMGRSEVPETQLIAPDTQVEMLAALLDSLHVTTVDLVANDSGGLVAQLFLARHPHRVRSLLLTNCDVDKNNPPPNFLPAVVLARKHIFAERFIMPQLADKNFARSPRGIGGQAFTWPQHLADETIEIYLRPLVETPLRKTQLDAYTVSMALNELDGVRDNLRAWKGPARILWAMKDTFFPVSTADWLSQTLPGSRGVRRIEQANLFFPEEMPDLIAEEAHRLWSSL